MADYIHDMYADTIMVGRGEEFDAFEVHGVVTKEACCEVDDANPEFYSVYAHLREGGVECVGDFSNLNAARGYAVFLEAAYGYPLHDYLPK